MNEYLEKFLALALLVFLWMVEATAVLLPIIWHGLLGMPICYFFCLLTSSLDRLYTNTMSGTMKTFVRRSFKW